MTLPSSGNSIAMSQINTELARSAGTSISLDTAENGGYATINIYSPSRPASGNPASMSEWYSYNHSATTTTTTTTTTVACYSYAVTSVADLSACFVGSYGTTRYSNCSTLSSGGSCYFYTNSSCTSLDYPPATSYYQTSDGVNVEYNFLAQITNTANTPC